LVLMAPKVVADFCRGFDLISTVSAREINIHRCVGVICEKTVEWKLKKHAGKFEKIEKEFLVVTFTFAVCWTSLN
jgi:hypothetical protein